MRENRWAMVPRRAISLVMSWTAWEQDWTRNKLRNGGYLLKIEETKHLNFSDVPLWSPFSSLLGYAGSIDGRRGLQIINAYTLAFFEKHLKKTETN